MKNKIMMIMLGIMLMMIPFVIGEEYMFNGISIDYVNNLTKETASYWFVDTSESGIGKNKDINILLWSEVEGLPFDFSGNYSVVVDWCNYTIDHDINIYDNLGNLINVTNEKVNYYFENTTIFNSTQLIFHLRSRDSLRVIMSCHYTDSSYLYVENILVGRFYTYFPSFECDGCEKYSLEEITHQTEVQQNLTENELNIYGNIQAIIEWDWEIWLIVSWIIKFIFLFIGISLIFSSVYYYYKFLLNLSERAR